MLPRGTLWLWLFGCMFLCKVSVVSCRKIKEMDFCDGSEEDTRISILYKRARKPGPFICRCSVTGSSSDIVESSYSIQSWNIKDASQKDGGFFKLTMSSGSNINTIFNQTIKDGEQIFESPGTQETEVNLLLFPETKVPKELEIRLFGDDWLLNVTCRSGLQETTTGYSSTTTGSTDLTEFSTTPFTTSSKTTVSETETSKVTAVTTTPFPGNSSQEITLAQIGIAVAPIAGGVVGGVVVAAAIIAVLVICHIKRKPSTKNVDESKTDQSNPVYHTLENDTVYSLAQGQNVSVVTGNEVFNLTNFQHDAKPNNPGYMNIAAPVTGGYDHVALQLPAKDAPSQISPNIYDHVPENTEDCYNHLKNDANKSGNVDADYDTTAAASKAVKDLGNRDDYYSYDHLGTSTGTTVTENDYDTTVSKGLNTE